MGSFPGERSGEDSYPLTSFTWIYVPAAGLAPDRIRSLKEFWNWALGDAQKIAGRLDIPNCPRA
jgi:ABC-type phosphate transport system substrate-binding protein